MGRIAETSLRKLRTFAQNDTSRFWTNITHVVEYFVYIAQRKFKFGKEPSSELVKMALVNLKENGYYVVPNFISQEQCADLCRRIDSTIINKPELIHPGSSYDFRLHGIESIDASFKFFSEHPLLVEIANSYLGEPAKAAFILAARLEPLPENVGSGGGWHRDSNFRQIKAMIYLSDTSEKNGPFQLVSKSQKLFQAIKENSLAKQRYGEVRWTQKNVDYVLRATGVDRLKTLTGKAGTLAIFDTSAIHRGAPIVKGARYAITNYYYPERSINSSVYKHFYPVAGYDQAGLPVVK